MIGKTIGKYRIVGQLGRGGMGTVYKAVDQMLERDVAIKVINPELADTKIMKRFRVEATTLAKLNHSEIATVYEFFQSEKDLLLVMEFVRGETLEHLCHRLGALPAEISVSLIDKVLSALEHAHGVGIVHCDVKPANIMVTHDGDIKIMDFGTARMRGAQHGTVDGSMAGTPAYMSPEQVLGKTLDGRADLYAVGVVFYRLLTGSLPFEGDSAISVVQKQIADVAPSPRVHRPELPEWCDWIVERALAKPPDQRFQSTGEFRAALRQAAGPALAELTGLPAAVDEVVASDATVQMPLEDRRFAPRVVRMFRTLLLDAAPRLRSYWGALSARIGRRVDLPRNRRAWLAVSSFALLALVVSGLVISTLGRPAVRRAVPTGTPRSAPPDSLPEPGAAAAPVTFAATTLIGPASRQREASCRVVLSDRRLILENDDSRRVLYELPYAQVLSISYSRGLDPVAATPSGPRRVGRAPGGGLRAFGIFVERDWVSLRTANAASEFVVLRFDNDTQAKRALAALERRTGRTAERTVGRQR